MPAGEQKHTVWRKHSLHWRSGEGGGEGGHARASEDGTKAVLARGPRLLAKLAHSLMQHSWCQGHDDTRTPCQQITLCKGQQPMEILLQTGEFCTQQPRFPSTTAVFHRAASLRGCAVYKRSDSTPCCSKHSRVNYSFNTFFGGSCSIHCETG